MKLKLFVSPDMGENCYFVIVDKNQFIVRAICLTHAHFDHAGAAEELKEHTNAPIFICQGEEVVAESTSYNLSAMFGLPFTVPYDRVLADGEKFSFGSLTFKVISTPGHTPGGGCFYFENEGIVFSGDTLFMMSVGRTDFPGGDSEALIDSIRNVYTGHGQSTSIGYEMENNGFVNQTYRCCYELYIKGAQLY